MHASDLEHGDKHLDEVLRDYSQGADILVYDAQYAPKEYESHRGWGHSTWIEATKVARDGNVKQLILFHHDPWHDDADILAITQQARLVFENTPPQQNLWVSGDSLRVRRTPPRDYKPRGFNTFQALLTC